MAQGLRVHVVLVEDPSSVPSTHVMQLITSVTSASGYPAPRRKAGLPCAGSNFPKPVYLAPGSAYRPLSCQCASPPLLLFGG